MPHTTGINSDIESLDLVDPPVDPKNHKTNTRIINEALRQLIDKGENSGELVEWNLETFLDRMKEESPKK